MTRPLLKKLVRIFAITVLCFVCGLVGYFAHDTAKDTSPDTATQLASQVTVLFPSYLTYAQQAALTKGTGLAGIDFIYVERQTGIDALTLMGIAAHESAWGSSSFAKEYNNVMSWGIGDANIDRTEYATKTLNVLVAARGLKKLYLSVEAPYYGGSLTLRGINKYYASDKNWANGVIAIIQSLETTLTTTQQMKRWTTKTGIFAVPVTWDYEHMVTGFALWKSNNATVTAGQ